MRAGLQRSSALVKCQSSSSESRGDLALWTNEALKTITEARRRQRLKADHRHVNGDGGREVGDGGGGGESQQAASSGRFV